ncbi:hypothetical protein BDR06DRAFT_980072 [Suillus hirtellus]|nr:hypothetical protein BDR06DRAFT_980072 [Suillus hirtellus]
MLHKTDPITFISNRRPSHEIIIKRLYAVNCFIGSVGDTPLIYLKTLSEQTAGSKAPQAASKTVAVSIIQDAENKDLSRIKLGGTVVKGTAGNTSIDLHILPVSAVPHETLNYNHQADEMPWTEQFDNIANAHVFYISTGSEIWEQRKGEIDCFVCAYLKERSNGRTQIWLTDPPGSVLHQHVKSGGNLGRVTSNFGTFRMISVLCQLLNTEGLYVGLSSVLNVVEVVELVQKLGKGKDSN